MNSELLIERRRWFRVFPEGTLEFAIITRVLALMLLMALGIVTGAQRPLVITALVGVLWSDYVLLVWWAVQVAMDLEMLTGQPRPADAPRRRAIVGVTVLLPSVGAVIAVLPWGRVFAFLGIGASGVSRALPLVGAIAFVAALVPACRALRGVRLGAGHWTALVLVPLVHWFALHRIAGGLDTRIQQQLRERGEPPQSLRSAGAALLAADVTWVLSILPWAVVVVVSLARGWPSGGWSRFGPVCGTILAAVFAIADLAALEAVQRQMVRLVRKP
ncbi:MAG: hypothetical protein HY718_14460 [Planctomycetes bacterium]|nr:hypothetical protein [Planctomycetota bacterium]